MRGGGRRGRGRPGALGVRAAAPKLRPLGVRGVGGLAFGGGGRDRVGSTVWRGRIVFWGGGNGCFALFGGFVIMLLWLHPVTLLG